MISKTVSQRSAFALFLITLMLTCFFTSRSFAVESNQAIIQITTSEKLVAIMEPFKTITMTTTDRPNLEILSTAKLTVKANIPWNLYLELHTDNLEAASQVLIEARTGYNKDHWVNLVPNGRSLLLQDHAIGVSTLDIDLRLTAKNGITVPFSVTPVITVTVP